MTSPRTEFELAFATPGLAFRSDEGERIEVRVESLGEIDLSGVAIGDPLAGELSPVEPPQGELSPRGRVELAIARWPPGDERVAAARLVFADAAVVRWVDAEVGLGVDAGTVAFASAGAIAGLTREATREALLAGLDANDHGGWATAGVEVDGHAARAFSSGYGDGIYAAYWGLDAEGRAAALVIDFEVLIGHEFDRFEVPRPRGRGQVTAPALAARGVHLRVPWLASRWLEVRADETHAAYRVYLRLSRPGEAREAWIRQHPVQGDARRFRVDLREVPDDAALVVRIVTGERPLPLM